MVMAYTVDDDRPGHKTATDLGPVGEHDLLGGTSGVGAEDLRSEALDSARRNGLGERRTGCDVIEEDGPGSRWPKGCHGLTLSVAKRPK